MRTRTFTLLAVAVFAVLVGGFLYVALGGDEERRAGAFRSYTAGSWYLEVAGTPAGQLKSVAGCGITGSIVMATTTDKRPGAPSYDPCEISFGAGLALAGWQWINDSAQGTGPRDVVILHTDPNTGAPDFQLNLTGAWISRFETPALNASTTDAATFRAELGAQRIERTKATTTPKATTTKGLLAANFRLTIPGLDTSQVAQIDSWSFETKGASGLEKPPPPGLGNLTLRTTEATAAAYDAYLQTNLVSKEAVKESGATLELLSGDLKTTVMAIEFGGVGIISGDFFPASESSTSVARREYSFYVESATIKYNG